MVDIVNVKQYNYIDEEHSASNEQRRSRMVRNHNAPKTDQEFSHDRTAAKPKRSDTDQQSKNGALPNQRARQNSVATYWRHAR